MAGVTLAAQGRAPIEVVAVEVLAGKKAQPFGKPEIRSVRGLGLLAQALESFPELSRSGLQAQGFAVVASCTSWPARDLKRQADAVVGFGIVRVECDGGAKHFDGIREAGQAEECSTEAELEGRRIGLNGQCRAVVHDGRHEVGSAESAVSDPGQVLEDRWPGVFGMAANPEHRRESVHALVDTPLFEQRQSQKVEHFPIVTGDGEGVFEERGAILPMAKL